MSRRHGRDRQIAKCVRLPYAQPADPITRNAPTQQPRHTRWRPEKLSLAGTRHNRQPFGIEMSRQVAFILRPIPVDQVRAICESDENMPPKSTFFYPKVLTGLVFNPVG